MLTHSAPVHKRLELVLSVSCLLSCSESWIIVSTMYFLVVSVLLYTMSSTRYQCGNRRACSVGKAAAISTLRKGDRPENERTTMRVNHEWLMRRMERRRIRVLPRAAWSRARPPLSPFCSYAPLIAYSVLTASTRVPCKH